MIGQSPFRDVSGQARSRSSSTGRPVAAASNRWRLVRRSDSHARRFDAAMPRNKRKEKPGPTETVAWSFAACPDLLSTRSLAAARAARGSRVRHVTRVRRLASASVRRSRTDSGLCTTISLHEVPACERSQKSSAVALSHAKEEARRRDEKRAAPLKGCPTSPSRF